MSKIVILAETGFGYNRRSGERIWDKISADARLLWKRYEG